MILIILYVLLLLYLIAVLVLYRGFNPLLRQGKTSEKPFVSVVVCAHNEEKNLPNCLRHLDRQDYPAEQTEFIIVNDRSEDRTQQIIEQFKQKDPRFKSIAIHDRLPDFAPKKRAIDTAIRQANGKIILLTDADGRPVETWISSMVSYFTEDTHMVLGYAPYTIRPANHFTKKLLALEYLSHAAVAAASTGLGVPLTCVGTNMAYRKSLYFEVGGFGPYKQHISGDDDLFLTWVREAKRYRIKYAIGKQSHVYNNPPRLWSKFLHQRLRYASKGFDYPLKITTGLIAYYLFNLLLSVQTGVALCTFNWPSSLLLIWGIKMGVEFIFMDKATRILQDRRAIFTFPILAVAHPFYVSVFGALGQLGYFRWKENTIEPAVQKRETNKE